MTFRSSLKGWLGEVQTTLGKKVFLNSKVYRDLNNVTLPTSNGTTQIDHVIVSRFGIFVIETKNMSGWIFGSERDKQWTQVFPNKQKYRFQNPLHQNYGHARAIAEFFNMPVEVIYSLVMFWGECTLKTELPPNVLTNGYTTYIKSKRDIHFSDDEVDQIFDALKEGRLPKTWATKRKHVKSLKERHDSQTRCPKCGSDLHLRSVKKGARAGAQFLGCSAFPKCRFTRDITEQ